MKTLYFAVCILGAALLAPALHAAQAYPARPLRLIVPYGAGGNADILARLAGARMAEVLGQAIIIDNRPGASGVLGSEIAARAAPDGHTLLWVANGHATNPIVIKKMPFDPLKDLASVSLTNSTPMLLVAANSLPADNVKALIAYAKQRPGQINYATASVGSPNNLAGELLNMMAGIRLTHVPYKTTPQATSDVIAGHMHAAMASLTSVLPHVRTQKLKALGTTGPQRSALAPEVPAIAETVPGYQANIWNGLIVPAATPRAIVDKLNQVVMQQLKSPELREKFAALGAEAMTSTPAQFDAFIRGEMAKWEKVISVSGMRVQ
ncbi:MAG: tripartite tricarboxylate transporter substrate binding protein [Betaproteobacteria bacterium]|nr:tripartite tricarboxylate transporter substrate binding protein [Betaproteobacteria bacterium]